MKFTDDINEILDFINCYPKDNLKKDYNECLNRFTSITEDDFLNERACEVKDSVYNNENFEQAFCILASNCDGEISTCERCYVKKYCNHYINLKRSVALSSNLNMIDLFCGAGGLSLGFSQEGFTTVLANDIEPCCIDTYAHNHPETSRKYIVHGDIKKVIDDLEGLVKNKKIDIVVGGPPCQGFSMANRQRMIDDPRNYLYKSYVEIVKRVQPKFFVMENVKGMFSVADQVKEDFEAIGYNVHYEILNAKDFGVPQNRERLIYIGNRMGIDNSLLFEEIHITSNEIPNYYLKDAIFGLKELMASRVKNATKIDSEETGSKIARNDNQEMNEYLKLINGENSLAVICNHKARYNNDRDIEIFGRMEPGDKSDDPKIADIMPYSRRNDIFKDKYFKLDPNKVCKTITAHMKFDCNMYIHPSQARGLTPREAARVQSYPDDYFFRGAFTKTYMQIGNSVPPLLGRAIAKVLKKYMLEA